MLVLSGKSGQKVILGDDITVQVISIQGGKVRLGFSAPSDVVIRREEICFEVPDDFPRYAVEEEGAMLAGAAFMGVD